MNSGSVVHYTNTLTSLSAILDLQAERGTRRALSTGSASAAVGRPGGGARRGPGLRLRLPAPAPEHAGQSVPDPRSVAAARPQPPGHCEPPGEPVTWGETQTHAR